MVIFARNNAVCNTTVYRTMMICVKLALYPINSLVLFGYTHHNSDTMLTEFLVLVSRHFVLTKIVDLICHEIVTSR